MTGNLNALLSFLIVTFLPVIYTHGNHTLHPVFSKVLDNDGNFHLLWNFDDDVIVLEMRVRTTGYIGLGLSPNGGMAGSDIIVVGVDDITNKPYIHDLYGVGNEEPVEDDHTDWEILSARQNETHTIVRVSRKLDTCDQHDRTIQKKMTPTNPSGRQMFGLTARFDAIRGQIGTQRVIWSYHPMDWTLTPYRYHGTERRGAKSVFLLNPQKVVPSIPEGSFTVDFLNSKVRLPSDGTTYWCQLFNMPTFDRKHHVIQFEAVIQPGNEAVVHHMTMSTCPKGIDNSTAGTGEACYAGAKWGQKCASIAFGWGVGGGPFYFPEHVGYPIGIDDDPKLIILQTHFDNPKRRSDIVDSSGIRLTVTSRLRRHDAGTLITGLRVYNTFFIPPHAEKYRVDGHCFAECLEEGMGNETSINVFATFLHTHLLGTAMRLRHFRHGVEQRPISDDENYDFNFQETRLLADESRVIAGDNLVTECDYRTTHKKNMTFGGISTSEEMCLAFVLYYPRVPIRSCYSIPPASRLAQFVGVKLHDPHNPYNNYIKSPPEYEGLQVQRVLADHIDWRNETNIARAQQEMTSYDKPVTTLCYQDLQHFFFREGRSVKPPAIKSAWRKKNPCSVSSGDRRHPLRDVILLALMFIHVCLR